jgi:tetratricopeptide (TPR) repeat protein
MPVRKRIIGVLLALFCFVVYGAQFSLAASKDPTTWWPDPSTGLMWTGQASEHSYGWKDANDYCASLQLGGYSGWRLPTMDELKTISVYKQISYNDNRDQDPMEDHYYMEWKGGITAFSVWTTTLNDDEHAWVVRTGKVLSVPSFMHFLVHGPDINHFIGKMTTRWGVALCTRPMEAGLLAIAKDAQVKKPVPDLQTLKDYALLGKARVAYQAGQYQESITQAKNALPVKPDFAPAYWAIGISYGRLGQWDLAITNLETALKIDKDYGDAKDALKWAKEGQKAAKTGGRIKEQNPQWN